MSGSDEIFVQLDENAREGYELHPRKSTNKANTEATLKQRKEGVEVSHSYL